MTEPFPLTVHPKFEVSTPPEKEAQWIPRSLAPFLAKGAAQLTPRLKWLRDADGETRMRWSVAIRELQTAVLETQAYVARIDRGDRVERAVEYQLFNRWAAASNAFCALDGPLASRLQLKAEYWANPEARTSEQVKDAGISLDHVAQYTRQLLLEA